ncbi:hypothetical protein M9H77_36951 [Catharanthus roseus]|uniref:Uncharacterized protein n=1 Tax=Catharanthus roseus TaxID=4058 RepID=A0ACB9ZT91_CATRO|nr:hypothetical protein M9H77_36951 [Catharanthus roseus]
MKILITSMAASASTLIFSSLLLLLPFSLSSPLSIQLESSSSSSSDLVNNTCKNTPNYQLCISTLRSDPRSSTADVSGLGLIVVDAVKGKATSTLNTIKNLKKSKPQYKHQLDECSRFYDAILNADVPEAIEALTKGDPKFAENGMADTALEVQLCQNGFKGSKSPIANENTAVYNLSIVARAIIRMLL